MLIVIVLRSYANDAKAMVSPPNGVIGLSLRNKIAVVYADGNQFGAMVK